MGRGAAEKDVIISEEDSVSAEDESDLYPLSSVSLSSKDDESEGEERVDERESEGVPVSFLFPGAGFLCDCSSNTPSPRF